MKKNRRTKKGKKGIIRIIISIIILFSLSSAAGFKFAEKSGSKINVVSTSNKQTNVSSTQSQDTTNKQQEINNKDKSKEDNKLEASKTTSKSVQTVSADGTKVAYLTFDDGPTPDITSSILDILKSNDIKATFFVVGKMAEKNPELLLREKNEGHAIANHTYSHNYKYIYSSTGNFLEDLKKGNEVVTSIIGDHNKTLIRFPGGSFGRQAYKKAIESEGYHYVDWNALNGDAEVASASVDRLIRRLHETVQDQKELIILMHDATGKGTTVQALPEVIEYLKSKGYVFKTLE